MKAVILAGGLGTRMSEETHPMDTLRDKIVLEGIWKEGRAPWKIWA
jgi:GTP:adenosylcobinamide-phosphate guanylyltransferase